MGKKKTELEEFVERKAYGRSNKTKHLMFLSGTAVAFFLMWMSDFFVDHLIVTFLISVVSIWWIYGYKIISAEKARRKKVYLSSLLTTQELGFFAKSNGIENIVGISSAWRNQTEKGVVDDSLKEKELIDVDGNITKQGMHIAELLKKYSECKKYITVNNVVFAPLESEQLEIIVLKEVEPNALYSITMNDREGAMRILGNVFPVIHRREPEEEDTMTQQEVTEHESDELRKLEPWAIISLMQLDGGGTGHMTERTLTVFEWEGNLYRIDAEANKFYRLGQDYTMEEVLGHMNILW